MVNSGQIFFLSFTVLLFSCKEKKEERLDCAQLRTGRYEYRNPLTSGRISIQRNDSLQIENDSEIGLEMNFKVTWQSPCEYHLEFLSFTDKEDMSDTDDIPLVRSEIIKVTPNYYISRSVADGESIIHVDTILIIK